MKTQEEGSVTSICASPMKFNFLYYCLSLLMVGMSYIALGPLIPYYTQKQHRSYDQFSLIFIFRGVGYTIGALSVKITQNYLKPHQGIAVGLIIAGVSLFAFNYTQSMVFRSVFVLFAFFGTSYHDIYANIATYQCFKGKVIEGALLILHSNIGLGGFIAPLVVVLFKFNTYLVLSIILLLMVPLLFCLKPLPQTQNDQQKQNQFNEDKPEQQQSSSLKPIPLSIVVILSLSYFFSTGCQVGYASWISGYSVMKGFQSKQTGALFASLFTLMLTIFRIISSCFPGNSTKKIGILSILGAIFSTLPVFILFNSSPRGGLIVVTVLVAFTDAPLFGAFQSQTNPYGYQVTQQQFSTFLIFVGMSQGLVSALIGYTMQKVQPQTLFYWTSLFFLIVFINNILVVKILTVDPQVENGSQLQIEDDVQKNN